LTTARAAEGPATRLAAVAWARVRKPYKQVAAVLRAKGRIAVATYRIRLRISTARWIFPLCRTMAGENAPSSGGCGPNVARFLGFQPSLCPKRHLDRFSRLRSAHNCDRQTDRQTDRHIDHAAYVAIIVRSRRRVEFKIACLVHQSLTSTAPMYLSADIQLVSEHGRRHLRSSFYRTLAVPRTRTTLGDRNFAVAGPRVWYSLPATLRQITSYGQFRQHLKTHLFRA